MVADMLVHSRRYSAVYILGCIQVFAGFVIANLSYKCFMPKKTLMATRFKYPLDMGRKKDGKGLQVDDNLATLSEAE
ncbi:hypothetical protein K7X08_029070 [Anisodus acutangulus]|uniref:Uncharacterized protein n=1 Tax=Anisodus acutangulus TaxID=402998 RepID=A0A9Q1QSJ4_9SOLA|nr:hypothetical protein K7X08_029070 [Anisodus acutangulus]